MDKVRAEFVGRHGEKKATVTLEIADTPDTRSRGLSKRASLDDGHGMFFDKAGVYWMKDVNFPLDLTFITKSGEVLETVGMPVDRDGVFHYSPSRGNVTKAAHAVETPFGYMKAHGITPGDTLVVSGNQEEPA